MKTSQAGSSKVWILVIALAAAVGAILYVGAYWPPSEEGVSGTIVPAERYRSNQIGSEDVILGEEESQSGEVSDDLASGLVADSADKADKADRADQADKVAQANKADKVVSQAEKANKADRASKADQANKADRASKADQVSKADQASKADKADKADKAEKASQ